MAICGEFDLDKNTAAIDDKELDVFFNYDEVFELKNVDEQFKKYIDDKIKANKKE